MALATARDHRIITIGRRMGHADQLMAMATHDTMKQQIRLAIRDLNECLVWLAQENVDNSFYVLRIVDVAIELATARLSLVNAAMDPDGSDALDDRVGEIGRAPR
jgi:hypothetical protein